jgi:hypothetical protein
MMGCWSSSDRIVPITVIVWDARGEALITRIEIIDQKFTNSFIDVISLLLKKGYLNGKAMKPETNRIVRGNAR